MGKQLHYKYPSEEPMVVCEQLSDGLYSEIKSTNTMRNSKTQHGKIVIG